MLCCVDRRQDPSPIYNLISSRIAVVHQQDAVRYVGADADVDWRDRVDLFFDLDPSLRAATRASLIEEAGGRDRLVYRGVRRALAPYVEREVGRRWIDGALRPAWISAVS